MFIHLTSVWAMTALVASSLVANVVLAQQPAKSGPADAKPKIPDRVYVKMTTTMGDIVIELNQQRAPLTVKNFLSYVDDGFYAGTMFHRVIKNFMIQGGGMEPGYKAKATKPAVHNEADNGLKNTRGTIAMARTGDPHSATSQFFINVVDNPRLDHTAKDPRGWGYCVFGRVIGGLDTVEKIRDTDVEMVPQADPSQPAAPRTPVTIQKVVRVNPDEVKPLIEAEEKRMAQERKQVAETQSKAMEGAKALVSGRGGDPSKGTTTPSGLWYVDLTPGEGPMPKPSDKVRVHYTGWLTDGSKFDSSVDRGQPTSFGLTQVIKGWTEGVGSMKAGGKRLLIIPPELAYGAAGRPGIPPNSILVFEVELLGIN
jgi:FKBP-type peptidyl-prolyl cis-trans isomerase